MTNIHNITQQNISAQNTIGTTLTKNLSSSEKAKVCLPNIRFKGQAQKDTAKIGAKQETPTPKTSTTRAIFKYLDQETINQANETGKLPKNMMLTQTANGKYVLVWKDPLTQGKLTGGTQTIPKHLELRRDIFGFTHVVTKDYDHILIK